MEYLRWKDSVMMDLLCASVRESKWTESGTREQRQTRDEYS